MTTGVIAYSGGCRELAFAGEDGVEIPRSLRSATYSARSPCGILAVLALQQEYSQLVPVKLRYVQNT